MVSGSPQLNIFSRAIRREQELSELISQVQAEMKSLRLQNLQLKKSRRAMAYFILRAASFDGNSNSASNTMSEPHLVASKATSPIFRPFPSTAISVTTAASPTTISSALPGKTTNVGGLDPHLPHPQPHPPISTPPTNLLQRFSNLLAGIGQVAAASTRSVEVTVDNGNEKDDAHVITNEPSQPSDDENDNDNLESIQNTGLPLPDNEKKEQEDLSGSETSQDEAEMDEISLADSPLRPVRQLSAAGATKNEFVISKEECVVARQFAQQILHEDHNKVTSIHPSSDASIASQNIDISLINHLAHHPQAYQQNHNEESEDEEDERVYVDKLIEHPQEREMRLHFLRQAFIALFTAQDMIHVQHLGRVMCSILGVRMEEEAVIMETIDKISPAIVATFAIESLTHQLAQFFT